MNVWTGLAVCVVVFGLWVAAIRFRWHVPLAAVKAEPEPDQV